MNNRFFNNYPSGEFLFEIPTNLASNHWQYDASQNKFYVCLDTKKLKIKRESGSSRRDILLLCLARLTEMTVKTRTDGHFLYFCFFSPSRLEVEYIKSFIKNDYKLDTTKGVSLCKKDM